MDNLKSRRSFTRTKIDEIKSSLVKAESLAADKACVYATGSFGRRDASAYSDLDLFIVGKSKGNVGAEGKPSSASQLSSLKSILIKAELIDITERLGIPEFDGDGRYFTHYSFGELTNSLGTADDDAANTFTARLLLLLESSPIVGVEVYEGITADVVAKYWGDFEDHKRDFVPAFLANDILRLWRTLCVNYEAYTRVDPPVEKAKRKLKNYKLKHSRVLTCFSTLIYLLGKFHCHSTVTPEDAVTMVSLSPTERLEWVAKESKLRSAHESIADLLSLYDAFLMETNHTNIRLIDIFQDKNESKRLAESASSFGNTMSKIIQEVGHDNRFFRMLIV